MLKLSQRKVDTARGPTKVWYIKGVCPFTGDKFYRSTRCHLKGDAEVVLAKVLREQKEKAQHGDKGTRNFGDAVIQYLHHGGEARFLTPLVEALGDAQLGKITDEDLTKVCRKVYPKAGPGTLVRQVYGPFQAVWNWAAGATWVHDHKWPKPQVPKRKPVIPDESYLMAILKAMTNDYQKAALLFMSFSGRRASEVVNILVKHHDPVEATVLIGDTKNDDPIVVALPSFVNSVLAALPHKDPDARLFGYSSRFALTNAIKRAATRSKIQYYSPHKAGRHLFARRFLAEGHTLRELMDAGGWRSYGAVMIYAHLEKKGVHKKVRDVQSPVRAMLEGPRPKFKKRVRRLRRAKVADADILETSAVEVQSCHSLIDRD